ncbi:MAG: alginate export family protein [Planctomycetota bacterium]
MSQPNLSPTRHWSLAILGCGLLIVGVVYPGFGQVVIVDLPSNDPPSTPELLWLAAPSNANTANSLPAPPETSVDEDPAYGCCDADAGCGDCPNGCSCGCPKGCSAGCSCGCGGGKAVKAAAKSHKILFYDNDFSYLLDPCYSDCYLGDSLKRLSAGHCMTLDVGGQFRLRQHSERNHRKLGLTGNDDDFLLYRTRLYANAEIGDGLRAYAEMIDAVSNYETFSPRPIEENRTDLLNLFGDVRLHNGSGGELWARLGRQELLYGAERTVSPLDWANTRRTFEGYKAFWKGDCWNVDAFWTRPVVTDVRNFDSPNYDQQFMGVYASRHGCKDRIVDLYYLRLDNDAADFDYHTFGGRIFKEHGPWMLEVEAAYQFGDFEVFDHSAGAWTCGLGRKFDNLHWKPTLWAYYDWASGSDEINNG